MLEEGSALVALIRPGTLNAYFEGKSMTQHYIDRKSGKDEVKYFHPALEPILKDTYGVLVYQEQSMMIAREIAGFTEQEADNLRKAMGKKLADLMAKVKISFIEGAEKKGIVTKEEAEQIFEWIEASNRYSFNRCLDPTTTVNTKDEIKMLCELNLGDMILAPNKNGQDHYVEVIDIIHNGEKEVYEIETDSGHSIKCTLDHKFLCSDFITRPLYEILDQGYEIIVYNN
jgi:DNA polymerase-3 subunit alpha